MEDVMREQLSMEFNLHAGSGCGNYLVLYDLVDDQGRAFHTLVKILNRDLLWEIYCKDVVLTCFEDGTCNIAYGDGLFAENLEYFSDNGEDTVFEQLQVLQDADAVIEFKKYESIDNHYRQKTVNYIIEGGYNDCEWVKLLKIHGANYSFSFNGDEFKKGKRNGFLEEGFYGDHHFDYDDQIKDLYHFLKKSYSFLNMTVYGEIYGGVYNHPEVPKLPGYTKVQQEIHYCPHNAFAGFDIELDGVPMNWDDVSYVLTRYEIPFAPVIERGRFEDLVVGTTEFPDPLHKQYGLPAIEGNEAEGWVIKPLKEARFRNGSRVILKGRNPKFKEQNKVVKTPTIVTLSNAGHELQDELFSYVNENRLRNVLSHDELPTQKDFGKVMGSLSQDAFKDFLKDHGDKFELLELKEQGQLKKMLNKVAGNVIRPNFVAIVDGDF